jgi:hypothetical protein
MSFVGSWVSRVDNVGGRARSHDFGGEPREPGSMALARRINSLAHRVSYGGSSQLPAPVTGSARS